MRRLFSILFPGGSMGQPCRKGEEVLSNEALANLYIKAKSGQANRFTMATYNRTKRAIIEAKENAARYFCRYGNLKKWDATGVGLTTRESLLSILKERYPTVTVVRNVAHGNAKYYKPDIPLVTLVKKQRRLTE